MEGAILTFHNSWSHELVFEKMVVRCKGPELNLGFRVLENLNLLLVSLFVKQLEDLYS